MLLIGIGFTLISILVPFYQWYQRRVKEKQRKEAASAMLRQNLKKSINDERLAALQQQKGNKSNNNHPSSHGDADDVDDDVDPDDVKGVVGASTLTPDQLVEREERKATKLQHKKSKILFRNLVRNITVENQTDESGKQSSSSSFSLTHLDVDDLLSHLSSTALDGLIDQLWPILSEASSSSSSSDSHRMRQSASKILEPILTPIRNERNKAEQARRVAEEEKATSKKSNPNAPSNNATSHAEWTPVELSALAKATAKYPGGVSESEERGGWGCATREIRGQCC